MPFANFKSIRGVSSEDCKYPSENLLKQTSKKWKTKGIGERVAFVILELSEPYTITGVDIGNEHSAFIEVLGSKTSCDSTDFTEILVTCSFMTPIESKNSTNVNRVRCFGKDALVSTALSEKWQFIKVICTQPFNKHIQYGISFIKIHVAEIPIDKCKISSHEVIKTNDKDIKKSTSLNLTQLGIFKLREESPESDSESTESLFKRWKTCDLCVKNDGEKCITPIQKVVKNSHDEESLMIEKSTQCMDRNRKELVFGDEEKIEDDEIQKKRHRLSKKIEQERQKLRENNEKSKTLKENKKCGLNTSQVDPNKSTYNSNKVTDTINNSSEYAKKGEKREVIFRPYNQLLNGTVLVISGIQNPDRANIRDKALGMGAKYKADWGEGCTHLICAFKNTPKYNQVKGKGKIVTRAWIDDCHRQTKCLPWRRYALDSSELHQPESEEEILDESLRAVKFTIPQENSTDIDANVTDSHPSAGSCKTHLLTISSGSDTEDEIRRVLESNNKSKANEASIASNCNVFDVSTEEENFLAKKLKVDENLKSTIIFKNLVFIICEDIRPSERNRIEHFIKVNGGLLTLQASRADYLISTGHCTDKIATNGQLVKPEWIYECNDMEVKIPIRKYLL